jgi:hypothetical protein
MQDLIHTKYKIWDYFQDKIACHSLFIHNPAKALEPNMIKKAKHKTDTQPWHREHDPEHHGERRMRAHTLGLYLKQNMGRWQQG